MTSAAYQVLLINQAQPASSL